MRSSGRMVCAAAIASLLAATPGCFVPKPLPDDPFAESIRPRQGMRDYRIGLEVVCDRCEITYAIGGNEGHATGARDTRIWQRSMNFYAAQRTRIRLVARGGGGAPEPTAVRIYIDGELRAERVCEECARDYVRRPQTATGGLAAETMIGD